MRLFDAHCHLQDPDLPTDIESAIASARRIGVARIHCCGLHEGDWAQVLDLARRYEEVVPSFGLHPWFVHERTPGWADALRTYLVQVECGVGEIGLDRGPKHQNHSEQEEVFLGQIEMAKALQKPFSIHCRDAWGRLLELLTKAAPFPRGFELHSYSGATDLVKEMADLGAYFSFSGTITRSGNKRAHKALLAVPEDRLLIETDAPALPPVIDGKLAEENVPENLVYVLRAVAEARGMTEEQVADLTWNNACRLFKVPE